MSQSDFILDGSKVILWKVETVVLGLSKKKGRRSKINKGKFFKSLKLDLIVIYMKGRV